MTIEEAKSLKPGDKISGTFGGISVRTITACQVKGSSLHWSESTKKKELLHSWSIDRLSIAEKTVPEIINNYPIY